MSNKILNINNADRLAIDSVRNIDDNGYLHIAVSPLTKETVNPYYGYEIPNWEELGLERDTIYKGYRKGSELEKAVETFNGVPLLKVHEVDSSENPLKEERVGSIGTSAKWDKPYITNAITVTDNEAIKLIESGKQKELSACYRYTPVLEKGVFDGESYDFIMTEIKANHVALVDEGRAGPDVYVYDKKGVSLMDREKLKEEFTNFAKSFMAFLDGKDVSEDEEVDEDKKEVSSDSEADLKDEEKSDEKVAGDSENQESLKDIKREEKSEEDVKKAMDEKVRLATKSLKNQMARLYEAAEDVRNVVSVKPFAYDSADKIYETALKKLGVDTAGVHSSAYKSLFKSYCELNKKEKYNNSKFAKDNKDDEESVFSKIIRVER